MATGCMQRVQGQCGWVQWAGRSHWSDQYNNNLPNWELQNTNKHLNDLSMCPMAEIPVPSICSQLGASEKAVEWQEKVVERARRTLSECEKRFAKTRQDQQCIDLASYAELRRAESAKMEAEQALSRAKRQYREVEALEETKARLELEQAAMKQQKMAGSKIATLPASVYSKTGASPQLRVTAGGPITKVVRRPILGRMAHAVQSYVNAALAAGDDAEIKSCPRIQRTPVKTTMANTLVLSASEKTEATGSFRTPAFKLNFTDRLKDACPQSA